MGRRIRLLLLDGATWVAAWGVAAVIVFAIACGVSRTRTELPSSRASSAAPSAQLLPEVSQVLHGGSDGQSGDQPALRYGMLGRDACESELAGRQIAFVRVPQAPGVLAPIR